MRLGSTQIAVVRQQAGDVVISLEGVKKRVAGERIGIYRMLKAVHQLRWPDPYFSGAVGFVGSTLEALHDDMRKLELPATVPTGVLDAMTRYGTPTSTPTFRMTC
jgi:hypothetical protein